MNRELRYTMGFAVNGSPIPDPSVFTGKESALDSEGGRDANGLLHRKMVATKHPLKLEYHNLYWQQMEAIMNKLTGESFNFTYPDPMHGTQTIKAYVGDRDWTCTMASQTRGYLGDLSFSVIEF